MKFVIKHETKGRIRVHMQQKRMTYEEADTLLYYLQNQENVCSAKVYDRTQDVVVCYSGGREEIITLLKNFQYKNVNVPIGVIENSGRELNAEFQEKLANKLIFRVLGKTLIPAPVRSAYVAAKAVTYIWKGVRALAAGKLEVSVLDGTAIGISVVRGSMDTASSIMFLLGIGELLEDWTHKKSVGDLARSMSLNVNKVWLLKEGQEILVQSDEIVPGDQIVVHMGTVIPFDGVVADGEAMVNQASLTGEPLPVSKKEGSYVYAGTAVEEGELTIIVKEAKGATRFEKIVTMIEESEKLKSSVESRAERLADRLVPYTLAGTGLTWLFTRNITKALAVLMVDFSCALKLAMPITVLSAIREANQHHITVKGGRFLELIAQADTIVLDKTGTLTEARPTLKKVISFSEKTEYELLRIAACLEEHFPHSMAKAVVRRAKELNLEHEEMHSKVEYIVAHGISSFIDGDKVVIGSAHFVFEDENCVVEDAYREQLKELPMEYSHLYLAIKGKLEAVLCIEDPLREEAPEVIRSLRALGMKKVVMMTGDSEHAAATVAKQVGVDEYFSEVLPEHKSGFVEKEKAEGKTVIMVGDGINDSPALSAADVGIAVRDGAEIAREIADISIAAQSLHELVVLKALSNALIKRIQSNYTSIVTINTALIVLGVTGIMLPTTSALIHNASTLLISLESMKNLL